MLSRISLRDAAMLWLMNWFQCLLKHLHLSKNGLKFPKSLKQDGTIHSLGAIDGKHVTIRKPSNAGSYYYNYKHTHSIILLAIAGPEYECLYADVGSNGRVNDSGVWNKSSLLQAIQNGSVKLPKDDALPVNGVIVPYVFVGDDAFALKKFMMKPYPQQNLTADKRVYNYRHSRARRISENLFGILANRWRIFFTTINLEPKHVENTVFSALA